MKVLIALLFSIIVLSVFNCNPTTTKPNILFILADDQAYNTIHALGNKEIFTPALDKLSEEGMTFTHAYNGCMAWRRLCCLTNNAKYRQLCLEGL